MRESKFSKIPKAREAKAEAFINASGSFTETTQTLTDKFTKEKTKAMLIRLPESLWDNVREIRAVTGLSMNAICLDLLRSEVKRKLKEVLES